MVELHDGLIYDTSKAKCIGNEENGESRSDFNFKEYSLYVTKNDRYFSVIETRNAGGEDYEFEYFNEEQAMAWLENYNYIDELQKRFPGYLEDA